jgi:hypothetical protein
MDKIIKMAMIRRAVVVCKIARLKRFLSVIFNPDTNHKSHQLLQDYKNFVMWLLFSSRHTAVSHQQCLRLTSCSVAEYEVLEKY